MRPFVFEKEMVTIQQESFDTNFGYVGSFQQFRPDAIQHISPWIFLSFSLFLDGLGYVTKNKKSCNAKS